MTFKDREIKEIDVEGQAALDVISEADNFNRWMFESIVPYCKGEILEIGSGIGNISTFFIDNGFTLFCSDIRTVYCEKLKAKFSGKPNLLGIDNIDIVDPDFDVKYKPLTGRFDTVFSLNVVEHIENDVLAIMNCKKMLKPGGKLVILVPAFQFLYSRFDKELEHYRRYNAKSLNAVFKANGLEIIKTWYFNAFGTLGWFVTGKILKKKGIPQGQMRLYNALVPVMRFIDVVLFNQFGLSVITVGKKEK